MFILKEIKTANEGRFPLIPVISFMCGFFPVKVDHGHLWLQLHVHGVCYYQSIICQPEVKPGPALPVENDVSFFNFYFWYVIVFQVVNIIINLLWIIGNTQILYLLFIADTLKTLDECEIVNWRANVGVELNRQKSLSFSARADEKQKKVGIISSVLFVDEAPAM